MMELPSLLHDAPETLAPDAWRENVAAIVMDAAGRVLLGLGTGGNAYWHFPQGGISGKETAEEALRRELMEEVNLAPEQYSILAVYGGLRYRYRKGNEKSAHWRGQEQTYILVRCHNELPATDCSHTDEFATLAWVPWRELNLELFAPFKRKVLGKVLATFFPPHLAEGELMPYLLSSLSPCRYRLAGRALAECPADDRSLYGGGKEEMAASLSRLGLRLRAAHKAAAAAGSRLLVLLHGPQESGRKQCLRRLAAHLDPLHLRASEANVFAPGLPWELLPVLPAAGCLSFAIPHPAPLPQDWAALEQWLTGQGIRLLKLYLHTGEATPDSALLDATDSAACPWYIIPSERRWYRDYVAARLLAESLEAAAAPAPLVQG